jgi:hypothetical protein
VCSTGHAGLRTILTGKRYGKWQLKWFDLNKHDYVKSVTSAKLSRFLSSDRKYQKRFPLSRKKFQFPVFICGAAGV